MLDLPGPVPAHVFPMVCGITLHGFVPAVQMLRGAAHVEGLQEQVTCIVAGVGEGLTAVRELFFGIADIRQDKRLQRPDELMETILPGFLQAIEQSVEATNGALEFGFIRFHRHKAGAERDGVLKPLLGDRCPSVAYALTKCRELTHLPDIRLTLLGRAAQQIGTLAFHAPSEVEQIKKKTKTLPKTIVHSVENFGIVRGLLDEEDGIRSPKAFHLDGAEPLCPSVESAHRHAGHHPSTIR